MIAPGIYCVIHSVPVDSFKDSLKLGDVRMTTQYALEANPEVVAWLNKGDIVVVKYAEYAEVLSSGEVRMFCGCALNPALRTRVAFHESDSSNELLEGWVTYGYWNCEEWAWGSTASSSSSGTSPWKFQNWYEQIIVEHVPEEMPDSEQTRIVQLQ